MQIKKDTVGKLIADWLEILIIGRQTAYKNARAMSHGLNTRLKIKKSRPKVLDHKTHLIQKRIQATLVRRLPNLEHLICSEPAIMDHDWLVEDYIELYYDHYTIVIQKLCEINVNG